jgi:hypothetical protein
VSFKENLAFHVGLKKWKIKIIDKIKNRAYELNILLAKFIVCTMRNPTSPWCGFLFLCVCISLQLFYRFWCVWSLAFYVLGHDFFELCEQHKKEHVETNKVSTRHEIGLQHIMIL